MRNTEHAAVSDSNAARADIVDILRLSQTQFGDQARQRYQVLILAALQAIADTPHRIGSHDRDEIAPGLRSYHLIYLRQQATPPPSWDGQKATPYRVLSCGKRRRDRGRPTPS